MNLTNAVVRGLVLGTVAGVVYVASRRSTTEPPRLVQWDRVRSIAAEMSRRDQPLMPAPEFGVAEQYRSMVIQSEELIGEYLKMVLPVRLENVDVFDRGQWVDANIESFQLLFEPLEELNRGALHNSTLGTQLFGGFNQNVVSGQLGVLMGYLSRRVLGQYDGALLGREPVTTGRLYFVEPNIMLTQRKLGLNGREFRTWIALHETTHAFEFEAHPWLRDYMNGLLREYFDTVGQDLGRFGFGPGGVVGLAQRVVQNAARTKTPLEWFMSDQQRGIFQRLQALMCLLEGYSNHVMDAMGTRLLPTYPIMKERFESRRSSRSAAENLFIRLTGLDLKFEQYVLGEKFVNNQVREVGIDRLNQIWRGPETLPTLAEIYEPERWRERLGV